MKGTDAKKLVQTSLERIRPVQFSIFKFKALFRSILRATENKLILGKFVKRCHILLISSNLAFDIVNFPFLDGDVPRRPSYGVYISQLIRFARVCSHVDDFNTRNKCLTAKLLKQGYRYHKLRKAFSKFYRRHYELISKFNVGLK